MNGFRSMRAWRAVRSPWMYVLMALLLVGALVWVTVATVSYSEQYSAQQSQGAVLTPAPIETVTLSSVETPSPTEVTSSVSTAVESSSSLEPAPISASSATSTKPVPVITAADPQHLIFECRARVVVDTELQGMSYDEGITGGDIHPPTGRIAYYLDNFGSLPSSPGHDTTFVFGHAWTRDKSEVFNPISEMAFDGRRQASDSADRSKQSIPGYGKSIPIDTIPDMVGCTYKITTETGVFVYEVTEAYVVKKAQWQYVNDLAGAPGRSSGRLVTSTCLIDIKNGIEKDWNVVTYAEQVSAKKI